MAQHVPLPVTPVFSPAVPASLMPRRRRPRIRLNLPVALPLFHAWRP